jgi:hypothetical protein
MATRRRHDSNEDEATAIDMREASSKVHAALAKRKLEEVSPRAPTRKRSLPVDKPLHGSSEAPEENTEFLSRPSELSSSEISSSDLSSEELSSGEDSRTSAMQRPSSAAPRPPRAAAAAGPRTYAPCGGAAARPSSPARPGGGHGHGCPQRERPRPARQRRPHGAAHHAHLHVARGPGGAAAPHAGGAAPARARLRRRADGPLGSGDARAGGAAQGAAAARAHRGHCPARQRDHQPPRSHPVASAHQDGRAPPSASSSTTGGDAQTLEAEPADGTLIVDVPAGAVVFVNGVERGRGPSLKVRELDRYAKHAVRVHAEGFSPWKGTVSLDGRVAAKVRPNLKARGR